MFIQPILSIPQQFMNALYILNTVTLIYVLIVIELTPRHRRIFSLYPIVTVFVLLLIYTAVIQFQTPTP